MNPEWEIRGSRENKQNWKQIIQLLSKENNFESYSAVEYWQNEPWEEENEKSLAIPDKTWKITCNENKYHQIFINKSVSRRTR